MFLVLLLVGCTPLNLSSRAISRGNTTTTAQAETPLLIETPGGPLTAGHPIVSNWQRYVHPVTGVSFDYPANWSAKVERDPGSYRIIFRDPETPLGFSVQVSISWVSAEAAQNLIAKPPAVPGEGGYALVWYKSLSTPMPGWEYVVGPYPEGVDTPAPGDYAAQYLSVLYADPERGYTVEFSVDFDYESFMRAKNEGFENAVAEHFAYFEHMAKSVAIEPVSLNKIPFLTTLTPAATGTPARINQTDCSVNPDQLSLMSPDGWMVQPAMQKGFCIVAMKIPFMGYSLSYPDDWVITLQADFIGKRGQILWFRPLSIPDTQILV